MTERLHRIEGRLDDRRFEWLRNTICDSLTADPTLFDAMLEVEDGKFNHEIMQFFEAERPELAMLAYVERIEEETKSGAGGRQVSQPNQSEAIQKSANDRDAVARPDVVTAPAAGEQVMRVAFSEFPENITEATLRCHFGTLTPTLPPLSSTLTKPDLFYSFPRSSSVATIPSGSPPETKATTQR